MLYPRPSPFDSAVLFHLVGRLLPAVLEWRQRGSSLDEQAIVREDLLEALAIETDGYTLAKYLDDVTHWTNVDADLVQILDRAVLLRAAVYRACVQGWVETQCIEPEMRVNDNVTLTGDPGVTCVILEVVADQALYRIQTVNPNATHPGRSTLVPFEDVALIESVTAQ